MRLCTPPPHPTPNTHTSPPPTKTQISLRIRTVWSEYPLSTWSNFAFLTIQNASREDSDQTVRIRRYVFWRCVSNNEVKSILLCCNFMDGYAAIKLPSKMYEQHCRRQDSFMNRILSVCKICTLFTFFSSCKSKRDLRMLWQTEGQFRFVLVRQISSYRKYS